MSNKGMARRCASQVRHHLSSAHLIPPFGLDKELELVRRFCENAELNKESHATLLMGPRNTGKTLVLNTALRELQTKIGRPPVVIQLDGYLQVEPTMALAAISDELGVHIENAIPEDDASEAAVAMTDMTFYSNVLAMLVKWRELHPGRAVYFILDQLELFAKTKQSMLYSLLNLMQEKEPPIAIVGISSTLHIMDMLEKRVKSRFSDRFILFLPHTTVDFAVHVLRHVLLMPASSDDSDFAAEWNSNVNELLKNEEFLEFLTKRQAIKSDPRDLFNLVHLAIKDIGEDHPFPTAHDFSRAAKLLNPDMKLEAIKGAPALEMGLLVAMKLFEDEKKVEYNFEMVYERFHKFARDEFMNVTKPTAFAAFESLMELELVKKVARRAEEKATPKEYLMVRLMPTPQQIEEVLKDKESTLPQSVITWGTKWVA